ncbi:hypothetical protein H2248_010006 [Termitomyces sp. 'cryptogamus']|nr:hypothetical protein H2248_010006 [Termitomyces sp. 'cryptogamus']
MGTDNVRYLLRVSNPELFLVCPHGLICATLPRSTAQVGQFNFIQAHALDAVFRNTKDADPHQLPHPLPTPIDFFILLLLITTHLPRNRRPNIPTHPFPVPSLPTYPDPGHATSQPRVLVFSCTFNRAPPFKAVQYLYSTPRNCHPLYAYAPRSLDVTAAVAQ